MKCIYCGEEATLTSNGDSVCQSCYDGIMKGVGILFIIVVVIFLLAKFYR